METLAPLSFESGDLLIRAYRPGDGAALHEAVSSSLDHLKPWMPWATPDGSVARSEANCRRILAAYLRDEDYTLGAWIGGELVAGTGFHLRVGPREWKAAEIGMWIRASRAGRGLGTRLLAAMLEWGFGEWGWERLVWKCDAQNLASARVAQKNGLRREALFRSAALDVDGARCDMELYAILKAEYRQP